LEFLKQYPPTKRPIGSLYIIRMADFPVDNIPRAREIRNTTSSRLRLYRLYARPMYGRSILGNNIQQ